MTSISAPDLAKLRQQQQYSTPYLAVLQPDYLLEARAFETDRGARSIIYNFGTGTMADFNRIVAGMTMWIGTAPGTYDVGKVRVKSIAGTNVLGDVSIAENAIDWVNGLYITIIDFYDIWPIPPRITTAGVFLKDYSITYTDQNEDVYPIAIMGPHRAGFLVGGSLVFTLDGSDSYAVAQGAAITGYAWTATGGVIANAAIATTTITFSAAGYYWVTLTVTDDNGKTQLTRRCYFVYDTSNPPYRDFSISNCGGDWNSAGWSFSAEVVGDVELADFQDGTLVVLWHQNYIDDSEDYVNIWPIGDEVICAGYLQRDVDTDDLAQSGAGSVSFSVLSPTLYMAQKNIMATVAIEANSAPAAWNEYETWLTAGRAVHHLLRWHSTVIETCDVSGLVDNTLQVYQVAFTEDSLLDMVNTFAYDRGIFAKLVSAKDGRLYFVEDSNYLDETDRTALDTVMTITAQDLSGAPQLAREPLEQVSLAFLDGFDYDGSGTGTPYLSIIPGYVNTISIQIPEFWGRGSINKPRQIIDSQADANMKCGRVLAVANNPLREMRLEFRANYLGAVDIVPNVGWYRWGIANATLKRGLSLLNTDWLCRRVEIRFPGGDLWPGAIQVSAIFEGEAFGEDAIPGNYPKGYPTPTLPTPNWDIPAVSAEYGYWAGGVNAGFAFVAITDRILLSSGVSAANAVSNLSVARDTMASVSDKTTYGYFMAGFDGAPSATTLTDRITFSTGVTAASAPSATSAIRNVSAGLSDGATYGYTSGGQYGGFLNATDEVDRIVFTTGATAAFPAGILGGNRISHAGISDGVTYGYWVGGSTTTGGASQTATVELVTFASGVSNASAQVLSVARDQLAALSDNSMYGYVFGGRDSVGTPRFVADRVTFSTNTFAANALSNLSAARLEIGAVSDGATQGYISSTRLVNTADKITFATGVTAASAGSVLSTVRTMTTNGGVSDGAV